MDEEVDKQLWANRVPIAFKLAEDEVTPSRSSQSSQADSTCYMMLPRVSYFSFTSEALASFFGIDLLDFTTAEGSQQASLQASEFEKHVADRQHKPRVLWFEYKGYPLKWHVPIGVLFDCLAADLMETSSPWQITVHTKNFPEKALLPYSTITDLERHFLCRLKEACFIKQGTFNLDELGDVQSLKRLWSGLLYDNYNDFQDVNQHLMSTPDNNWFKHFPFCLYVTRQVPEGAQWEIEQVVREPYTMVDGEGMPWLLGDLLTTLLGTGYTFTNAAMAGDTPEAADGSDGALEQQQQQQKGGEESGTQQQQKKDQGGEGQRGAKIKAAVLVHGIEPPLDTPLQWLATHMSHPDNFCHIILRIHE